MSRQLRGVQAAGLGDSRSMEGHSQQAEAQEATEVKDPKVLGLEWHCQSS